MDTAEEDVTVPTRSRRWWWFGLASVLLAGMGFVVVKSGLPVLGLDRLSARGRHMRVLARLEERISPVLSAFYAKHGGQEYHWKDPELCAQGATLRAMQMSLYNVFYHGDRTPETAARLRAIADRLEANDGADLQTPDGCRRLFVLFEEASPDFKTYSPTFAVYQLRDEGKIRTLQAK